MDQLGLLPLMSKGFSMERQAITQSFHPVTQAPFLLGMVAEFGSQKATLTHGSMQRMRPEKGVVNPG